MPTPYMYACETSNDMLNDFNVFSPVEPAVNLYRHPVFKDSIMIFSILSATAVDKLNICI